MFVLFFFSFKRLASLVFFISHVALTSCGWLINFTRGWPCVACVRKYFLAFRDGVRRSLIKMSSWWSLAFAESPQKQHLYLSDCWWLQYSCTIICAPLSSTIMVREGHQDGHSHDRKLDLPTNKINQQCLPSCSLHTLAWTRRISAG